MAKKNNKLTRIRYLFTKTLTERFHLSRWDMNGCGAVHDRDVNAAINIRTKGMQTAGTAGLACLSL